MKIQRITSQNRRDFYAIYVCQHCEHTQEGSGYDDSFFHESVIPTIKCDECGKAGGEYRPLATKYPDSQTV